MCLRYWRREMKKCLVWWDERVTLKLLRRRKVGHARLHFSRKHLRQTFDRWRMFMAQTNRVRRSQRASLCHFLAPGSISLPVSCFFRSSDFSPKRRASNAQLAGTASARLVLVHRLALVRTFDALARHRMLSARAADMCFVRSLRFRAAAWAAWLQALRLFAAEREHATLEAVADAVRVDLSRQQLRAAVTVHGREQKQAVAEAFGGWCVAVQRRRLLARGVAGFEKAAAMRAFDDWHATVLETKRHRGLVERSAARMLDATALSAFYGWVDWSRHLRRSARIVRHLVGAGRRATLQDCLESWSGAARRSAWQSRRVQVMAGRLRTNRLGLAVDELRANALARRWQKTAVARCAGAIRSRRLYDVFGRWARRKYGRTRVGRAAARAARTQLICVWGTWAALAVDESSVILLALSLHHY